MLLWVVPFFITKAFVVGCLTPLTANRNHCTKQLFFLPILDSPRYLTQYNGTLHRVREPPIGKNGALRQNYSLGIKTHDKICLYLVNKSCFLPAGANLTNKIQIISLEYCKIHGHFVLPCPPGHGTIYNIYQ